VATDDKRDLKLGAPSERFLSVMKILFVRVSAIGDVIHTLPALFMIKKLYPESSISWLVQKKAAALLVDQPILDKTWVLPDNYLAAKNLPITIHIMKEIRATQWDAIIDFQGILKTSILLYFLHGKKYGFDSAHARDRFTTWFTDVQISPVYTNIIQKNLALASHAIYDLQNSYTTCPSITSMRKDFTLAIPESKQNTVRAWLTEHTLKKYILLAPNTTWESKLWPETYWRQLFELLHERKNTSFEYDTILLGKDFGNPAQTLAQYIHDHNLSIKVSPRWDLLTTAHLLTHASLIIGPDTGLIHLADFLGVPSISIFGPTNKDKHGPFLTDQNCSNAIQIKCPHVYEKTHGKNQNAGHTTNCMYKLTPTMLYNKIMAILETPSYPSTRS